LRGQDSRLGRTVGPAITVRREGYCILHLKREKEMSALEGTSNKGGVDKQLGVEASL